MEKVKSVSDEQYKVIGMEKESVGQNTSSELIGLSEQLGVKIDKWLEENIIPSTSQPAEMYENFWDALEGGKGLRELATYVAAEALGADPEKTIPAGAAQKLGQSSLVIFDDMNDDSYFRRGGLCLHRKIGPTKAQLVALTMLARSYHCLSAAKLSWGESVTDSVLKIWSQMLETTGDGQYAEHVKNTQKDFLNWTEKLYFDDATEKAGDYTLGTPFAIAAIIAGITNGVVADLRALGRIAGGEVFQPVDDILNLEYLQKVDASLLKGKHVSDLVNLDEDALKKILGKYGKEPGGDILEGKQTLPVTDYIQKIKNKPSEFEWFKGVYGNKNILYDDVLDLAYRIKDAGSIEYARSLAREKKEKIIGLIPTKIPEDHNPGKLFALIDFAYNRSY